MKVKCINIFNHYDKKHVDSSLWLTIDKEYIVLAMEILQKQILFRILDNDSRARSALYEASQFQVTSGEIPKNWHIFQLGKERFAFGPVSWEQLGFWEKFYEYDPEAQEIFQKELRIILETEG